MHLMKEVVFPLAVFFAGLTLFCTKNSPTGPGSASGSGSLETAASVVVGTETIPSSGGTFAITNSSSAINGFSITVPANAFSGSRDFQVSTSEIKSHTFGADFHPVTPVVTIDAGAGYADSAIIITILRKFRAAVLPWGSSTMQRAALWKDCRLWLKTLQASPLPRGLSPPRRRSRGSRIVPLSTTALSILVSA